jgi:ATP-dependent DNA helicase HFM1/MER3
MFSTTNLTSCDSANFHCSYSNTTPEAIAACVRIIAVSATLPNIQDVAEFLGANEAFTFDDSYRPVPLNTRVVGLGYIGKNEYRFWMNLDEQIPHLIARYSDGKPTLVFCHTKKETENLVQRLINNKFCNHGGPSAPAGTVQYCLDKGVAYHHAGMEASERRRVEQAFADRKIRCLCATSTLAVGVNLPAHLVIVKGTKTWRGGGSGYQEIDPRSLLQMMGRAGRPGLDTSGMAIIMTDNSSKSKFENMTRGLGAADSQLLPKLVDVFNTEISHRVITDLDGAMRWLKTTFLFACLKASPIRFGIDPKTQSIDGFLLNQCQQAIDLLCEVGLVGEHETLFPREACHIMSQSMVPFDAMKLIASLSFDATQCQILKTISDMKMLHFPVRRLEKKALNACHKSEVTRFKLEGPLSKVRIQDSSQKTFVLLQAYISKQDLESFTLRREMSNMADKAQHILLTAQEYSIKGSKHGQVALQCLKLRRSLQLCLWGVSSGVLNQIQDVGHKSTAQLKLNGIVSFAQAIASTEEEIEKAAGRPKPFGKRLRTVVSKILCEKLNMMAEIEYTRGSNIPAGVQCHLRSPNQAAVVSETEKAKVNYTLVSLR